MAKTITAFKGLIPIIGLLADTIALLALLALLVIAVTMAGGAAGALS